MCAASESTQFAGDHRTLALDGGGRSSDLLKCKQNSPEGLKHGGVDGCRFHFQTFDRAHSQQLCISSHQISRAVQDNLIVVTQVLFLTPGLILEPGTESDLTGEKTIIQHGKRSSLNDF